MHRCNIIFRYTALTEQAVMSYVTVMKSVRFDVFHFALESQTRITLVPTVVSLQFGSMGFLLPFFTSIKKPPSTVPLSIETALRGGKDKERGRKGRMGW